MRLTHYFILSVCLLTLNACANHSRKQKRYITHFTANVAEDNSKRFEFTVQPRRSRSEQSQRSQGGNDRGRRGTNSNRQQADIYKDVISLLKAELKDNTYCKEDYFELNYTYINRKAIYIGECHDGATLTDKERWKK